jgi:hypothetical protein
MWSKVSLAFGPGIEIVPSYASSEIHLVWGLMRLDSVPILGSDRWATSLPGSSSGIVFSNLTSSDSEILTSNASSFTAHASFGDAQFGINLEQAVTAYLLN